jgi:hypothetical protein
MRRLNRGQELTAEELREIAEHFVLTKHARQRITERHPDVDIRRAIMHPVLAYFNTDGSINIALNNYEYIVVAPNDYCIITFKEKSLNNIDIFAKREMAIKGYGRKPYAN